MTRTTTQFLIATILVFLFVSPSLAQETQMCNDKTTLAWNMNTEPDMASYNVYHDSNPNVAEGGETVKVVSVAHDPNAATDNDDGTKTVSYAFTVPGDGTRFFAVTAVDNADNESGFSNEVGCLFNLSKPGTPTIRLEFTTSQTPSP